jgi:DNA-binding MarR family transcriptional regulator
MIAALARLEGVKPQSMGATIRVLENAGFVKRVPHATDKRQVLLSLTRTGRQVRIDAAKAKRRWLASAVDGKLTPAQQRTLRAALELLRELAQG